MRTNDGDGNGKLMPAHSWHGRLNLPQLSTWLEQFAWMPTGKADARSYRLTSVKARHLQTARLRAQQVAGYGKPVCTVLA